MKKKKSPIYLKKVQNYSNTYLRKKEKNIYIKMCDGQNNLVVSKKMQDRDKIVMNQTIYDTQGCQQYIKSIVNANYSDIG